MTFPTFPTTMAVVYGLLSMISPVIAHMTMNTPLPYDSFLVQSSPLDGNTFLFPCQKGAGFKYGPGSTNIKAGGKQLLNFTGSVIHGGGSCQVLLSKTHSANPADWKVIHSIVGGCPGSTENSNLETTGKDKDGRPDGKHCPGGKGAACVKAYDIPIPDLENGDYIWAWTWFNKIGNREIYMNCAPVSVSGGKGSVKLESLPSMFIANYGDMSGPKLPCMTDKNGGTIALPNITLGNSVEYGDSPFDAPSDVAFGACKSVWASGYPNMAKMMGAKGDVSAAGPAGASNNTSAPSISKSSSAPSTTATPATASDSTTHDDDNDDDDIETTSAPSVPVVTTSHTTAAGAASSPTAASNAQQCAHGTPCPINGAIVCLDRGYFGLCDHGCAVRQQLAAGTACNNGVISKRHIVERRPRRG